VNAPPRVGSPRPRRSTFVPGELVRLEATATDTEDGELTGAIVWTSSLQGSLGTGGTVPTSGLRSGTHTITRRDRCRRQAGERGDLRGGETPSDDRRRGARRRGDLRAGRRRALPRHPRPTSRTRPRRGHRWSRTWTAPSARERRWNVPQPALGTHTIRRRSGTAAARRRARISCGGERGAAGGDRGARRAARRPGRSRRARGDGDRRGGRGLNRAIAWTSSLEGPLATGGTLDVASLHSGTHTISASVARPCGKTAEAHVVVVVNAPPQLRIVRAERTVRRSSRATSSGCRHGTDAGRRPRRGDLWELERGRSARRRGHARRHPHSGRTRSRGVADAGGERASRRSCWS